MYKDKARQREANRAANKRYREQKGITDKGITPSTVTDPVIPKAVVCQTCGGPVQHPSIVKCYQCVHGKPAPALAPTSEPEETGPLSVYSPARWAYLQEHKHVWNEDRQSGVRSDGIIGVTVPGDTGYSETDTTHGDDLPADVLADIERMCSESNKGERASSHGRIAMVERAMRYQEVCGERQGPTTRCSA